MTLTSRIFLVTVFHKILIEGMIHAYMALKRANNVTFWKELEHQYYGCIMQLSFYCFPGVGVGALKW